MGLADPWVKSRPKAGPAPPHTMAGTEVSALPVTLPAMEVSGGVSLPTPAVVSAPADVTVMDIEARTNDILGDSDKVCRICHGGAEDGRLISPCRCSGSMKYVHISCLQRWRSHGSRHYLRCETCLYEYQLRRVAWAQWLSKAWVTHLLTLFVMLMLVLVAGYLGRFVGTMSMEVWQPLEDDELLGPIVMTEPVIKQTPAGSEWLPVQVTADLATLSAAEAAASSSAFASIAAGSAASARDDRPREQDGSAEPPALRAATALEPAASKGLASASASADPAAQQAPRDGSSDVPAAATEQAAASDGSFPGSATAAEVPQSGSSSGDAAGASPTEGVGSTGSARSRNIGGTPGRSTLHHAGGSQVFSITGSGQRQSRWTWSFLSLEHWVAGTTVVGLASFIVLFATVPGVFLRDLGGRVAGNQYELIILLVVVLIGVIQAFVSLHGVVKARTRALILRAEEHILEVKSGSD